jgi:hypothetical protein
MEHAQRMGAVLFIFHNYDKIIIRRTIICGVCIVWKIQCFSKWNIIFNFKYIIISVLYWCIV